MDYKWRCIRKPVLKNSGIDIIINLFFRDSIEHSFGRYDDKQRTSFYQGKKYILRLDTRVFWVYSYFVVLAVFALWIGKHNA